MKTVVETYIIEETQELIYDNEQLDKWNSFVTELGLSGQQTIVKDKKSPIPFLWMNTSLINVFTELCPRKVEISKYNKTPIPVEVLSLVSLSNKEGYFDKVEVWYNDKDPDPAVIGYSYDSANSGSEWSRDFYAKKYLIARWSDVKASFKELTERARKIFLLRKESEYKANMKNAQRHLEDLETETNTHFGFDAAALIDDLPF